MNLERAQSCGDSSPVVSSPKGACRSLITLLAKRHSRTKYTSSWHNRPLYPSMYAVRSLFWHKEQTKKLTLEGTFLNQILETGREARRSCRQLSSEFEVPVRSVFFSSLMVLNGALFGIADCKCSQGADCVVEARKGALNTNLQEKH